MSISFDELEESENQGSGQNDQSFISLPLESDDEQSKKKIHDWLQSEKSHLAKVNRTRFAGIRKNLALNKGIQYQDQDVRSESRDSTEKKNFEVQKIVVNKLKESNRSRASKLLKYKPNVSILPNNDELGDKVAAMMTKNLLDHIWYEQRFDGDKLPKIVNRKGPAGEHYLKIDWDPNAGDLHDTYKQAVEVQKKNKLNRVPLLDENGKPKKDDNGKDIYIDKVLRNGDVVYKLVSALDLLVDRHPSNEFSNARWSFEREILDVDEARLKYPKATKFIEADKELQIWDYEELQSVTKKNCVEIWHFYHKRSDYLDKGRYIVFTSKGILSNEEFPFSHKWLPYVRWYDHENEGEMHGVSFFEDCKGPFGAYNNLNNMILRNEVLVGHPKWMMPKGAADIRQLGNAITVVQFKGAVAPQLVQANPTGQGAYQLRESLKEEGMQMADVSRTGNGEPPKGITAAVALQYLSELEQERWNISVLNHNEAVLMASQMTLAVCGDYYDPSDKRMIRVQGQDGEWMSQFFEVTNLAKSYDIRIQGASALPETKAARTETLLFLADKYPDRVDTEQVIEMFGLAQDKKFVKEATISLRASEAENEMFMKGKKVMAPEKYEDQLVHWKSHVRQIREWSFKNRSSDEIRLGLEKHIAAHEMLMAEQAMKNPEFLKVLMTLPGFPLFFSPLDETGDQTPEEVQAELMEQEMTDGTPPYNAPVAGGEPILPEEQLPQEVEGELTQEPLPPLDQQMGLEQQPVEPTNSI